MTSTGDAIAGTAPTWPGWDIARGIAVSASGRGYAVLDGWGGVHPVGDAPAGPAGAYAPGSDWRGIAISGSRYALARRDGLSGTWSA